MDLGYGFLHRDFRIILCIFLLTYIRNVVNKFNIINRNKPKKVEIQFFLFLYILKYIKPDMLWNLWSGFSSNRDYSKHYPCIALATKYWFKLGG